MTDFGECLSMVAVHTAVFIWRRRTAESYTNRCQPRHLHAVIRCLPRYPDVRVLEGWVKVGERLAKNIWIPEQVRYDGL